MATTRKSRQSRQRRPGQGRMSRALAHCGHDLATLDRRDRFMARDRPPLAPATCFSRRRCQCAWHVEDGEPAEDSLVASQVSGCPVVGIAAGRAGPGPGVLRPGGPRRRSPRSRHRPAKPATAPPACASGLLAQHRIGQLERCIGALARAPIQLSAECRQQLVRTIILEFAFDLRRKAAILAAYCHGDTPDLRTLFVYRQALQRLNNELSECFVNQRGQWAL
jgi:hypothetical protein